MDKRYNVWIVGCFLLVTFLSGCAQIEVQWQKNGATQSEFNRDSYQCHTEAARTYPTRVITQQVTSGYTTPTTTECDSTGSAYRNLGSVYGNSKTSCTTTPGEHVPGVTSTVDVNAQNRDQALVQCMYARGWHLLRVK